MARSVTATRLTLDQIFKVQILAGQLFNIARMLCRDYIIARRSLAMPNFITLIVSSNFCRAVLNGRNMRGYEPSQAVIRRETAKIRKDWDDRTYRIRSGLTPQQADQAEQWTPPIVVIDDERLWEAVDESSRSY